MDDWKTTRTSAKQDADQHNNILIAVLVLQILLLLAVGACLGFAILIFLSVSDMEHRQLLNDLAIAQLVKWLQPH